MPILTNHVCSLESAKKLCELGVDKESIFYWKYSNGTLEKVSNIQIDTELIYGKEPNKPKTLGTWTTCKAFTSSELGEILPKEIQTKTASHKEHLEISKGNLGWSICYNSHASTRPETTIYNDNLSEALALMLIYLITNNLITL